MQYLTIPLLIAGVYCLYLGMLNSIAAGILDNEGKRDAMKNTSATAIMQFFTATVMLIACGFVI